MTVSSRLRLLLILAAAVVLIAAVALYQTRVRILSAVVERQAVRALEEAGLAPVTVGSVEATFRGAALRRVVIGADTGVSIGSIDINYTPLSVIRGGISSVVLDKPRIRLRADTAGLLLPKPLDSLPAVSSPAGFPVGRLEIREGAAELTTRDTLLVLPFEMTVTAGEEGRLAAKLRAWPESGPLAADIDARLSPPGLSASFTARDTDLGYLGRAAAALGFTPPLHIEGTLAAEGALGYHQGRWAGECRIETDEVLLGPDISDSAVPLAVKAADIDLQLLPGGGWRAELAAGLLGGTLRATVEPAADTAGISVTATCDDFAPAAPGPTPFGGLLSVFPVKSGRMAMKADLTYKKQAWHGTLHASSPSLRLAVPVGDTTRLLPAAHLSADIEIARSTYGALSARTVVFGAPLLVTGSFDAVKGEGDLRFRMTNLGGRNVDRFIAAILPGVSSRSAGRLDATAQVMLVGDRGKATAMFAAHRLTIEATIDSHDLVLHPDTFSVAAVFGKRDAARRSILAGRVRVAGLGIASRTWGIATDSVTFTVPLGIDDTLRPGTFATGILRLGEQRLPSVAGTYVLGDTTIELTGAGAFGPGAAASVEAAAAWPSGRPPHGELSVTVPPFATPNDTMLARWFPLLRGARTRGTFGFEGFVRTDGDSAVSGGTLTVGGASWVADRGKTGARGITGRVVLGSLIPPAVTRTQRLILDTAWSGTLGLGDPMVDFRYGDSVLIADSAWGRWAGGIALARNLRYREGGRRVGMELEMREVELQKLLDFLEYSEVRGEGTLHGRLPVDVRWGKRPRLSFGDGYLEARPSTGILRLSDQVARTVLGVKEPIPPSTTDPEKTVQLMMIRALRDMEYTQLKAVFTTEEDTWMTRIRAKGSGPRGAKENRVPVGGLNINVNNLDRLLTSLVMPSLRTR